MQNYDFNFSIFSLLFFFVKKLTIDVKNQQENLCLGGKKKKKKTLEVMSSNFNKFSMKNLPYQEFFKEIFIQSGGRNGTCILGGRSSKTRLFLFFLNSSNCFISFYDMDKKKHYKFINS